MLIAVFILPFVFSKASTERFFTITLVALYHGIAQEFDNKSFGYNPLPGKPKHS